MRTTMKKGMSLLLTLALMVSLCAGLATPAFAAGLNLTYELGVVSSYRTRALGGGLRDYVLETLQTYGAQNTYHVAPGGTAQVGFLIKNDANTAYRLYTMQNEIEYDSSFFDSVTVTLRNVGAVQTTQRVSGQDYVKVAGYGLGQLQAETLACILTFHEIGRAHV